MTGRCAGDRSLQLRAPDNHEDISTRQRSQHLGDEYLAWCEPDPWTDETLTSAAQSSRERYAEVLRRAGLPINEHGRADWKAVIEEERAKLEHDGDQS